ncbi:MAG: hypothetical protein IJP44_10145 [Bacteroidales bacterium]|nr:hypothetical protein [Bacteroidales bacterium]
MPVNFKATRNDSYNLIVAICASAQTSGVGLFQRGYVSDAGYNGASGSRDGKPLLLNKFGDSGDYNGETGEAPIGSGIVLLVGLGAAYMFAKRSKED